MNLRFAIASDLHIALPETIDESATCFHLTQYSIPALESVLQKLEAFDLDFLLLPGDLTQDGEKVNHSWLQRKLESLPFDVYVIPGNHDVPQQQGNSTIIAYQDFPLYYSQCGYQQHTHNLDYTCELAPNLQLIALNSNHFDAEGRQRGLLKDEQLQWLEENLKTLKNKMVMVMIHHNVIEHIPDQTNHILGKRYMLDNAVQLRSLLKQYGVKFIFTGHLHIQDIANDEQLYEITTGSLITYPHPFRILHLDHNALTIESHQVTTLEQIDNFAGFSQQWMSDRSFPFMIKMLTSPPLNLSFGEAKEYAPHLKDLWSNIAHGDQLLDFPDLPVEVNNYFKQFGAVDDDGNPQLIDNNLEIEL